MLWIGKSVDNRQSISRTDLQSAITDAVKQSDPDCEAFIDVIIEHAEPKSKFDANWALRGIKFGRSDRGKAAQAIAVIVARMQREFRLSEVLDGRYKQKPPRSANHLSAASRLAKTLSCFLSPT
jgi:hypothetical protein